MSTDKTLADVQPGGRVRLGDGLRPCPFCGHSDFDQWPCEYIDASGANVVRCARCHAAAPMKVWHALSAQPSPGGQDVRAQFEAWMATQHDQGSEHVMAMVGATDDRYQSPVTSSMWSAWQAANAAREAGRINGWRIIDGVRVFSASAHASIVDDQQYVRYDDYLAALAARQPVGEIDEAAVLRRAAAVLYMWEDDPNLTGYMGDFNDACGILELLAQHAAPPAQGVDLGQFRVAVYCMQKYTGVLPRKYWDKGSKAFDEEAARLMTVIDGAEVARG